jgi:dGTP triphosphohydrolase
MRKLFDHFLGVSRRRREWSALPIRQREELEQGPADGTNDEAEQQRARLILDFVAGLTEAQAYEYYRSLVGVVRVGILGPVEEGVTP